jgi:hypothetical protein
MARANLPRDPVAMVTAAAATNNLSHNSLATFVGERVALDSAVPLRRELQNLQLSHGSSLILVSIVVRRAIFETDQFLQRFLYKLAEYFCVFLFFLHRPSRGNEEKSYHIEHFEIVTVKRR